jgi:hypothetical protein
MVIHFYTSLPSLAGLRDLGKKKQTFPENANRLELSLIIWTAYNVSIPDRFTDGQNEGTLSGRNTPFSEAFLLERARRIWRAAVIVAQAGRIDSPEKLCQLLKDLRGNDVEFYYSLKIVAEKASSDKGTEYMTVAEFYPLPKNDRDSDYRVVKEYKEDTREKLRDDILEDAVKLKDDFELIVDANEVRP